MTDELLTSEELIAWLKLDQDGADAHERLRNLVRRQGLPVIKRGRLTRYRRSAVVAWLESAETGLKPKRK